MDRKPEEDIRWDEIGETFGLLAAMCRAAGTLFARSPDTSTILSLRNLDGEDSLALAREDPGWAEGLRLLAGYCRQTDVEKAVLDATGDHSTLFVGPTHVLAPPWSSIYLNEGRLFGAATAQVSETYRRFGLQVPNRGQEPEDHIAFELEFVAEMDRRVQRSLERGDVRTAGADLAALDDFLVGHLQVWLGHLLGLVEEKAETAFYGGLAKMTRSLVAMEAQRVAELSTLLDDAPPAAGLGEGL